MDYFQGVVVEYLRADRAVFVNTECCIQVNEAANPDGSGPHWYCDAVAVDFRRREILLCEITYSVSLGALMKRLQAWNDHWDAVCAALTRDCCLPAEWHVKPWIFVPEHLKPLLEKRLAGIGPVGERRLPEPVTTNLEDVLPWKYKSWNRCSDKAEEHGDSTIGAEVPLESSARRSQSTPPSGAKLHCVEDESPAVM